MSAATKSSLAGSTGRHTALPLLLGIALLVAFLAAWPLIAEPGFLNTRGGGDSPFLLQRLQQLETAIRDGHFPARWMRDANYGFGYPFFNFYAPLSLYAAAGFRFLGFSYVRAIESAQVVGFLLAGAGIFLLARRWYKHEWAALLSSIAYTTAPFHLVNVYVRGDSLAEFWAMAFYPWVILAADRLLAVEGKSLPYGRAAALALAYAALILSHNISALIFTPFLLLFIGLRILFPPQSTRTATPLFTGDTARRLLVVLGGGLLALALAAWFFLPALVEQGYAQLGPVTEGYFSFSNHFRGVDLLQTTLAFDYDVAGGNAFRMGLVQAITALLGAAALAYAAWRTRRVDIAPALFILLALALATFMVTPLSRLLWENLPLLPFTQFPWRFLSIQAFAAALATGALALLPYCRAVTIAAAAGLLIASFVGLETDQLLLSDQDITSEALAQYEYFTGNIGSTVSAEYLPPGVQPRFFNSAWLNQGTRAPVRVLRGQLLQAEQRQLKTAEQQWSLQVGDQGASLILPTMAWPGWQAHSDGRLLEIRPAPGSGHILLELPPGAQNLTLRLGRTPVRSIAELISLAALLVTLLLLFKARRMPRTAKPALVLLLPLIVFFLIFRFLPQPALAAATLNWDFAQMAYLHDDPQGVPFSSGTTLLRYDYSQEVIEPGQDVTITLEFSHANGDKVTADLGTPALGWPVFSASPPVIAARSATLADRRIALTLAIPDNAPAGMVIPRVTLDAGWPLMPSGRQRGDLFLRPLRIGGDGRASTGRVPLDVAASEVTLREQTAADVKLEWLTRDQLSHNYNASLLLLDSDGNWIAQLDTQPGYGFLPSSEWPTGAAIHDWLALNLPEDLPEGEPLALVARLYEPASGEVVLTRRLGEVTRRADGIRFTENEPLYTVPAGLSSLAAQFEQQISLVGYSLQPVDGTTWQLTLAWRADAPDLDDAQRFVHVFDPQKEAIVWQNDGHPRNNSYPLSQWVQGEIVTDTLTIDLSQAPEGSFAIATGFYRTVDGTDQRLTAVNPATADRYPGDRVVLPQTLPP